MVLGSYMRYLCSEKLIFCSVFILFLSLFSLTAQKRFEFKHQQMGTQVRLVFYADDTLKANNVAKAAIAKIDALNAILSDYKIDSELNKLCQQPNEEVEVSNNLYQILQTSSQIAVLSKGAFDITAGPLIRLWRKARKSLKLPSQENIKLAKSKVGHRYVTFPSTNTVRLKKNGMLLDLGGIGKGYAADEVLKVLEENGITSALIDMGGDICVSNPPPNKDYWILAFSYFDKDGQEIIQKIKLKNQAVATSGDLYQYVEINGQRYSHIVDPRTGMALTNSIQTTVIAPTGTFADAYASVFSVMGIAQTKFEMKNFAEINVFLVEHLENKYRQWQSEKFSKSVIN